MYFHCLLRIRNNINLDLHASYLYSMRDIFSLVFKLKVNMKMNSVFILHAG